jgi:FkbM family methyltransferase
VLNDRPAWLIARNALRVSNYAALIRMHRVYERPLAAAAAYFLGAGDYPCSVRVRTPAGPVPIQLFTSHDAVTVHEIFCREDYRCPSPPQVVVDIGANIGISALYFLTRSPSSYCELYEPDPRNVSRLQANLQGFTGRFTLHEHAVADRQGVLPFQREPTGRYGSLDVEGRLTADAADVINVRVEHVNDVLDRTLRRHGQIDLLKIDTEGIELATVMAIDEDIRRRVRRIVIESFESGPQLPGFAVSSSCDTLTFSNSGSSAG